MSLIDRAKNILLTPKTEWNVIAGEPATPGGLFTSYAMILAILPAIGTLLGGLMFSGAIGLPGLGMSYFLVAALIAYVVSLGVLYLMGIIANALSSSFDGQNDLTAAMKLVVYSATATWVAGLLSFIPVLGFLIGLAGFGYAAYLLYLGCQTTLRVPEGKAVGFTAVVILIWIVVYFIVTAILTAIMMATLFSSVIGAAAMYS